MPELLAVGVAGLFAALVALGIAGEASRVRRRRARMEAWRQAATALSLTEIVPRDDEFVRALGARAADLTVRLESVNDGTREGGTRLVVQPVTPRDAGLTVRRASEATSFKERTGGWRDVAIGDPAFDAACFVVGPGHLALALLDSEARRLLVEGFARGPVVEAGFAGPAISLVCGVLQIRVRNSGHDSRGRFEEILREGLGLARRLTPPPDIPRRLAENVACEPEPGVRDNLLATLAVDFPSHPATRPALRAAMEDPADFVRLHAALALGEEGHGTLRALVDDDGVADPCSARAIAGLGAGVSGEDLRVMLARALGSDRPLTAVACLEALGRRREAAAEPEMQDALRSPGEDVQLAAVAALGKAGTVGAVACLRDLEAHAQGDLRVAARHAIEAIQVRISGAAAGQLSLAAAEGGTLSLADDPCGRLSISASGGGQDEPERVPVPRAEG